MVSESCENLVSLILLHRVMVPLLRSGRDAVNRSTATVAHFSPKVVCRNRVLQNEPVTSSPTVASPPSSWLMVIFVPGVSVGPFIIILSSPMSSPMSSPTASA